MLLHNITCVDKAAPEIQGGERDWKWQLYIGVFLFLVVLLYKCTSNELSMQHHNFLDVPR